MSRRQSVVRDISQAGVGVNALMLNLSCQSSLNKMSFVEGSHRSNIRDSKVLEEIPEQTPDKEDIFEEDQSIKSINHVNLEFEKLHYLPPDIDRGVVFKFVVLQFFAYFFINIDMGILPAGSTVIKEELGIHNS